jgi:hypothetical protein
MYSAQAYPGKIANNHTSGTAAMQYQAVGTDSDVNRSRRARRRRQRRLT